MQELNSPPPAISVVIPTKNRPGDLLAAVQSLFEQSTIFHQLIVIDQSADADSAESVRRLHDASFPGRQKPILTYVVDPSLSGLTEARNRALELVAGEVVLFLDDDVVLEPAFLDELIQAYLRVPKAAGVSGIITNYVRPPLASRLFHKTFALGPFRDDRQEIYWQAERLRASGPVQVTRLGGGLMSFRMSAIAGLRFDPNLAGVSDGEDVDFCMNVRRRGPLLIAPSARLVHNFSPQGRATGHWLRREARATWYLYLRHWRHGFLNRACFAWLTFGYAILATFGSLRRASLEPWRALLSGRREGFLASGKIPDCPR